MQNSTVLNTQSVKDFVKSKGFQSVAPTIRANTNGYPYITFIDDKNVAENVYFSKNGAKMVGAGEPITKELISKFQVADCKNAAGEVRTKLVSNTERINILDLLD